MRDSRRRASATIRGWKAACLALCLSGCSLTLHFDYGIENMDGAEDADAAPDAEEMDAEREVEVVTWAKTFGGPGYEWCSFIEQTTDGGYFLTGMTDSFGEGALDVFALRLDGRGNVLWQRTYGGPGNDRGEWGQQTSDGGFVVAGMTGSYGAGFADAWVLKLDSNGEVQWQRTYGGESDDWAHGIRQLDDGGFVVAGGTTSFGEGGTDFWILRLDDHGDLLWERTYGETGDEYASSVLQTALHGFVVTGWTYSPYGAFMHALWLSSEGDRMVQWIISAATWGGDVFSAVQLSNGGYVFATTYSENEYTDMMILELDSTMHRLWSKRYRGPGEGYANVLQQTMDRGYAVAGLTNSFGSGGYDGWIIKTDSSGTPQWQKVYGGQEDDSLAMIQQTSDGGYIAVGVTESFGAGEGEFDVLALKMDESGDIGGPCPSEFIRRSSAGTQYVYYPLASYSFTSGAGGSAVHQSSAEPSEGEIPSQALCSP